MAKWKTENPSQNQKRKTIRSLSLSLDTHTLTIMAKSCFSDLFPICSISLVYFWKKCVRVSRMLEKMGENMKYNAMAMLSSEMNVGKSIFFTHTHKERSVFIRMLSNEMREYFPLHRSRKNDKFFDWPYFQLYSIISWS